MDGIDPTLLALWFHVPFVTAWVGFVILDVFAVFVPGLGVAQRGQLILWSRPFVGVAVLVIVLTGIWQTIHNPFLEVTSWSLLTQLRETKTYGLLLFWKHGFVLATFALTILVRFILAPRLVAQATAIEGGVAAGALQLKRPVVWLSVTNLGACLGALLLATLMIWQLH